MTKFLKTLFTDGGFWVAHFLVCILLLLILLPLGHKTIATFGVIGAFISAPLNYYIIIYRNRKQ